MSSIPRFTVDVSPTPADTARINRLVASLKEGEVSRIVTLERYTQGEVAYLCSIVPEWQRGYKPAGMRKLLRILRAKKWRPHNGDTLVIYVDEEGNPWLIQGQHRVAAFWTFAQEGGELPEMIRIAITRDAEAFKTLDMSACGRTKDDLARMNGHPRLAGSVMSGLLYEALDFNPPVDIGTSEQVDTIYEDDIAVDFVRTLPQSGGNKVEQNCYAGVYAGAIRAMRKYGDLKARKFFSALIDNKQTLDGIEVPQLVAAEKALKKGIRINKGGSQAKVMTATISMKAFVAWYEKRELTAQELSPPRTDENKGKVEKVWSHSMERPLPIEREKKAKKKAA